MVHHYGSDGATPTTDEVRKAKFIEKETESFYGASFYEVIENVYVHGYSLTKGDRLTITDSHYPRGRPEVEVSTFGENASGVVGWVDETWLQRFCVERKVATAPAAG